jgi:hypothetical protein
VCNIVCNVVRNTVRNIVRNIVALMPYLTLLPRVYISLTSNPDFASRVSTAPNIDYTYILSTLLLRLCRVRVNLYPSSCSYLLPLLLLISPISSLNCRKAVRSSGLVILSAIISVVGIYETVIFFFSSRSQM